MSSTFSVKSRSALSIIKLLVIVCSSTLSAQAQVKSYTMDAINHPELLQTNHEQILTDLLAGRSVDISIPIPARVGVAASTKLFRVVSFVGDGASVDVYHVLINNEPAALKLPATSQLGFFTSAYEERELYRQQIRSFNENYTQIQQLRGQLGKFNASAYVAPVIEHVDNLYTVQKLMDTRVYDWLRNYSNTPAAVNSARMQALRTMCTALSDVAAIADLHGMNVMFDSNNQIYIIDAGIPGESQLPVTVATNVMDATVLDGITYGGYANMTEAEIVAAAERNYPGAGQAIAEIDAAIRTLRLASNLPTSPGAGTLNCSMGPTTYGKTITAAGAILTWAGYIQMVYSVYDEAHTAEGAPPSLSQVSDKPGVICSSILPRVGTIWCERDYAFYFIPTKHYLCTYVSTAYENQRQDTKDSKSCSVEYYNYRGTILADSEIESLKQMKNGTLHLTATSAQNALSVLQSVFSYRYQNKDMTGLLVYPTGPKIGGRI